MVPKESSFTLEIQIIESKITKPGHYLCEVNKFLALKIRKRRREHTKKLSKRNVWLVDGWFVLCFSIIIYDFPREFTIADDNRPLFSIRLIYGHFAILTEKMKRDREREKRRPTLHIFGTQISQTKFCFQFKEYFKLFLFIKYKVLLSFRLICSTYG